MNLLGKEVTTDQLFAFGRHARTMAATAVGTAVTFKLMSGGDAASLQAAFDQISHGVAEIVAGVSAVIVVGTAVISAASANPVVQLLKGLMTISQKPDKIEEVKQTATIEQKAALVATTNNLDSVRGVPLKNTDEGLAIASIVPAQEVAVSPSTR